MGNEALRWLEIVNGAWPTGEGAGLKNPSNSSYLVRAKEGRRIIINTRKM